MPSPNPWHKRYHSDAIAGYMSLSLEERGAYTTLLDMMYDHGEPLVENERLLAGYLGVSLRKYRSVVSSLIEKGKILRLSNGRLSNSRFEKENEKTLKTSRKQAENGKCGGEKKAENEKIRNEINAAPCPPLDQQPSLLEARVREVLPTSGSKDPSVGCPKPAKRRCSYPSDFEEWWAGYPTDPNMSKKRAADQWRKLDAEGRRKAIDSLPGFIRYCRQNPDYRPVHAERYLSQERYEGHLKTATQERSRTRIYAGTEEWAAWLRFKNANGENTHFMERCGQDGSGFLVPSLFPPSMQEAAE